MIFNYCYGGIKIVTITINGAPGEKVTLTPTKAVLNKIEVTLNDKGVYTGELSKDEYTFVGEVSKSALASVKYEVKDGGIYNMWGDYKPLYWYGNKQVAWTLKSVNSYNASYHYAKQSNVSPYPFIGRIKPNHDGTSGSSYQECYFYFLTSNKINTNGYSTIKYDFEGSSTLYNNATQYIRLGYSDTLTHNISGENKTESLIRNIYSTKVPENSSYIGIVSCCDLNGDWNNSRSGSTGSLYACWLE